MVPIPLAAAESLEKMDLGVGRNVLEHGVGDDFTVDGHRGALAEPFTHAGEPLIEGTDQSPNVRSLDIDVGNTTGEIPQTGREVNPCHQPELGVAVEEGVQDPDR